jgi:porphobilinogen deaminase
LARLAGGCLVPVAGFATVEDSRLRLGVRVLEQQGRHIHEMTVQETASLQGESLETMKNTAENCGWQVAAKLLEKGAGDMLARMRAPPLSW